MRWLTNTKCVLVLAILVVTALLPANPKFDDDIVSSPTGFDVAVQAHPLKALLKARDAANPVSFDTVATAVNANTSFEVARVDSLVTSAAEIHPVRIRAALSLPLLS